MQIFEKIKAAPWHRKTRIFRAVYGWTQEEVAAKCGVDPKLVRNWESGIFKPCKRNRGILAGVLGVTQEELFN